MPRKLPAHVPCLPLGDVLLFPKAVLSLRIFEQDHKHMLTDVLKGNRMLATLSGSPPDISLNQEENWSTYAQDSCLTLGVVAACRRTHPETYDILLRGLSRVHCLKLIQHDPYPVVHVRKLQTKHKRLNAKLKKLYQELQSLLFIHYNLGGPVSKELLLYLKDLNDPETIIDAVAASLPDDLTSQHALHQALDTQERFETLLDDLREANASLLLESSLRGSLSRSHISFN